MKRRLTEREREKKLRVDLFFSLLLGFILRLALSVVARKAVLALGVREAGFLTGHIVNPLLIATQTGLGAQLRPLGSEVEPAEGVANSADFVADTSLGLVGHLGVKVLVGEEVDEVAGNSLVVAGGDEVTVDLVLDLERNTTLVGDNDGDTGVESLRDLDLEALAGGELENDVGVGDNHVEELIVGIQAYDADVLDQVGVVVLQLGHGLVKDDGTIGVINGAVAAAVRVSKEPER